MKKRKTDPDLWEKCSALWDRLWRAMGRSDAVEAVDAVEPGWADLWNQYAVPPASVQTHPDDLALLCNLGWSLASLKRNHALALERLEPFFRHPEYRESDMISRQYFSVLQGISLLYLGCVDEAVRLYSALLDAGGSGDRSRARGMVRQQIHFYCASRAPEESAPPSTVKLVNRLLAMHRVSILAEDAGSGPIAYGHLAERLLLTYPEDARPRAEAAARHAW